LGLDVKQDPRALAMDEMSGPIVIFIIKIIILIILLNLVYPSSYSFLSLEIKFIVFLQ
jgi:hypothetical protein